MMERDWAGDRKVTPEVGNEDLRKALANPDNEAVELFVPGKLAMLPNGDKVVRGEDGKWYKILGEAKTKPIPVQRTA